MVALAYSRSSSVVVGNFENPAFVEQFQSGKDGVIKAIELVQEIGTAKQINALGFCVGGTMLGTALAVLAARLRERDAGGGVVERLDVKRALGAAHDEVAAGPGPSHRRGRVPVGHDEDLPGRLQPGAGRK